VQTTCTKFSHRLQWATGLTCYFVARVGSGFCAINVMASMINYYFRFLPDRTSGVLLVINSMLLVLLVRDTMLCQRAEDSISRGIKPAELVIYDLTHAPFFRVFWIVAAAFDLLVLLIRACTHPFHLFQSFLQNVAFSLGCALFYNFIVVNPMPPGTSKLREWVSRIFQAPKLAYQEN
jgi:hypothetical protein